MKRMTKRDADGQVVVSVDGAATLTVFGRAAPAIDRLAAYEDTGLEPEEIEDLASVREITPEAEYAINKHADSLIERMDALLHQDDSELEAYRALGPIDHLRELAQAEQDGRLVEIDEKLLLAALAGARAVENNRKLVGVTYCWDVYAQCGGPKEISYYEAAKILREVFEPMLTRKEAEAALEKEEHNG